MCIRDRFHHAGSDENPLRLEAGQNVQGAAESCRIGVVRIVDDTAGQELEPMLHGFQHPHGVDEILERDAESQGGGDAAGNVLYVVQTLSLIHILTMTG